MCHASKLSCNVVVINNLVVAKLFVTNVTMNGLVSFLLLFLATHLAGFVELE